jgi:integrase
MSNCGILPQFRDAPMPNARKTVPAYLLHKQSGRARIVWTDANGVRRDKLLSGEYESAESRAAYARFLAELEVAPHSSTPRKSLAVAELLAAFQLHADKHYRGADGKPTSELRGYYRVIRSTRLLYAATPAADFGPLAMKAVRQTWVAAGLARSEVNRRTNMLRRIFKWALSEELVPAATHLALTAVSPLKRSRATARETESVLPVALRDVIATLPFLKPHARALIEFMRFTGCRPGEACIVRPCDIDMTSSVWQYRPQHHKNAYRGKARTIAIGPNARAVLEANMPLNATDYFFSPRTDVKAANAARREARVTPLYPSHVRRIESKRAAIPRRAPSNCYTAASLSRAVSRAITKVNADREASRVEYGPNLLPIPHWHPNQLRHSFATEARKRHGLEAAQACLGHARMDVTQIYAEKNDALATLVATTIG